MTRYLIWHPGLYLYIFVDDKVPYMAPRIIFVCFCGWQGTLYGTPDYICMFLWMTRYLIWHPGLFLIPYMASRIIFVCFCGWQGTLYGTPDYICIFLWMTRYLIWHPGLYLYVFVDDKVPYTAPRIIFVCFCGWQGTLYGTPDYFCMFLWMTRYLIWHPGSYLYVFVDDKVPYMAPRIIFVCFCGWPVTLYGTPDYICMFFCG